MKSVSLFATTAAALLLGHNATAAVTSNAMNPAMSLILDGQFSRYDRDPEAYELPGFALGGEAGLAAEGFSLGHSELILSANVDENFYGQLTLALDEHEGETKTELEEAFFQTIGLGNGLTVRGGRFFSAVGYHNQQHPHAWNFADAALVYRALFGDHYIDDGLRLSWIAPTKGFLELGGEMLRGARFPGAGEHDGAGSQVLFLNLGGDLGDSHSWQAGISRMSASVEGRTSGSHAHGGATETPSFSGDSDVNGLSLIYKWAPQGNYKNRNFKLQAEYFQRDEDGSVELLGSDPLESTSYLGDQSGYYVQGIFQFMPRWRTGLRYDRLESSNSGSDADVLAEAGLDNEGVDPTRYSAMVEWVPSEFSRVRLQLNRDDSYGERDDQLILQYTMSLGSHGAHSF